VIYESTGYQWITGIEMNGDMNCRIKQNADILASTPATYQQFSIPDNGTLAPRDAKFVKLRLTVAVTSGTPAYYLFQAGPNTGGSIFYQTELRPFSPGTADGFDVIVPTFPRTRNNATARTAAMQCVVSAPGGATITCSAAVIGWIR
jgi:hypothetical protein